MPATMASKRSSKRKAVSRSTRKKGKRNVTALGNVVHGWRKAAPILERWRRAAAKIEIQLRRPRIIDAAPIDFIRGEIISQPTSGRALGQEASRFSGHLIFFTKDDITVRRPSGAILVIDNYEIAALGDGRSRIEPA
ncbi:MAG: hypothetical protein HY046_07410 [Acidobacteria bacterium]|nr:hypothetical protein [Acidobacteriota bacterium]